ncbi:MAG: hypothetical protein GKS07_10305 [Nitrosopumilus sp.]|nr:MAG: hypothetical protein GKS07_10305 [Nitrosopumilus sp.]
MAEKKDAKKNVKKTSTKKSTTTKTKSKARSKKVKDEPVSDGLIIVEDDIEIDQEKINEERRAYLEEARSQEAID